MTKPILESVAKVVVVNEKKEALILTTGEHKGRPDKSYKPDLPGGLVDPGESELMAVVRELKEETGIIANPASFNLAYTKTNFYINENKSVSKFLYLLFLTRSPKVNISWEHSKYNWVSLNTLMSSVEFRPFYEEGLTYCFSHKLL
jgi:8-oxo-dGTP pyrophosphatase MutT (NUDIX family)